MQKLIVFSLSALLFLFSVSECLASTLIFKTQKEVKTENSIVELAVVDVSKYKQVRVGVILVEPKKFEVPKFITVEALENEDLIFLESVGISNYKLDNSKTIETPSNKIRISTMDKGTFKIFVWAS